MKKIYLILVLIFLFTACSKTDDSLDACRENFSYDPSNGKCVNCQGEVGFNQFDLEQIISSKSAECMKFPEMHLVYVLDTSTIEDFHEVGDNIIENYNFKGADLDATEIFFNELIDCNFEGTKMSLITAGYAKIHGKIDAYTEYPSDCSIANDTINCRR